MITMHRGQRGDAMLEALIGVVLMAVVGLGLAYTSARAVSSQRYLNTQNLAIAEVRDRLQRESEPCASEKITIDLANISVDFTPVCASDTVSLSYTIDGVITTDDISDLTTLNSLSSDATDASRSLFGGDGVVLLNLQ